MESAAAASAWVSRRAARSRLIATARRTLVSSSAASGRSRSANTLPELTSIDSPLLLRLRISHLIIGQCRLETAPDEFHVGLRGANTTRRLLLKAVQHINGSLKAQRIDRPKRVGLEIADDFEPPYCATLSAPPIWRITACGMANK